MFSNLRLVVLSLRAQSLLNLKLYKMKRHELKDYQKTIQDVLARSEDDQPASEQPGQISPTPSPAGSEGSNCCPSRQLSGLVQVVRHFGDCSCQIISWSSI